MSLSAEQLIINVKDPEKSGLLDSFFSERPSPQGIYFRGDKNRLSVYPVRPAYGSAVLFWLPQAVTTSQLSLGVGDADLPAEGGDFALAYDGDDDDLTVLAYNISAANLQTALNANAAIAAIPDTVAVTLLATGVYQVAFQAVGARELLTGDPEGLAPECNIFVSRLQTGDADTREIQIIQIIQRPYVYVTSWTATGGASAIVTELRAGSVSAKAMFSVELSPLPYAGSFTVKDSGAMAYNGTQAEWQTALGSGWSVLQTGDGQFTLERTTAGVYTLDSSDVDVAGLSVYEGLIGTLGFNAGTLFKRFLTEGDSSFVTTLEVKYDDGTYRSTILQVPVTLTKEILSAGALAPSNWNGGFYTKVEIDALLAALAEYSAISVSTAGNSDLAKVSATSKQQSFRVTVGSGSGSYTRTLALLTADASAGDTAKIALSMPASENPIIEIRNATSGGTVLQTIVGTGAAFTQQLFFTFNGTAWEL